MANQPIENDKAAEQRQTNAWWQPAVVIFSQVSAWIIGPILIALFVGKWLDRKYQSEPWLFIGLTVLAFIISSIGIVRVTAKYTKKIEAEAKAKKEQQDKNSSSNS